MILEFSDRSQTNWREMQVALCSIIRMSAFSADEELLVFYASNAFPVLRDELALIEPRIVDAATRGTPTSEVSL